LLFPIILYTLKGIVIFLNIYSWFIVLDAAFTLFSRPKDKDNRLKLILRKIVDPVNNIFRKELRKRGTVAMPADISPLLSLIVIWIVIGFFNLLLERSYEIFFSIGY
jgi:uncharacterized protein YggT (Ycf19 family)